jgi:hypothetical protein
MVAAGTGRHTQGKRPAKRTAAEISHFSKISLLCKASLAAPHFHTISQKVVACHQSLDQYWRCSINLVSIFTISKQ